MHIRQALVVTGGLALLSASTNAAITARTGVTARVYDSSGHPEGTTRAALALAAATLSPASIEVMWQRCPQPGLGGGPHGGEDTAHAEHPCDVPLTRGELAVRFLRSKRPATVEGTLPLGDAMIDTRTGSGVLATIYIDRVAAVAGATGTDTSTLLGRAIAHELGHLLLARRTHSASGLMRPLWTHDEVRRGRDTDWMFLVSEIDVLRSRASH